MPKTKELTLRVIIIAIILTIILATANTFLALKLGMLTSASIPAAILSMGILRFFKDASIYENNMIQTAASAGEAVAGGIVYTIPALIIIGFWQHFSYFENFFIACSSGLLGVLFSVPLRSKLVSRSDLPFPEGQAIAAILKNQQNLTGFRFLLWGLFSGATIDFLQTGLHVIAVQWTWWLNLQHFAIMFSLGFSVAMMSAGFLIGPRMALSIMIGAIISWYMLLPYFSFMPHSQLDIVDFSKQLWTQQIRYLGVGALLFSGVASLFILIKPLLAKIFASPARKITLKESKDLPSKFLWLAIALISTLILLFFKHILPLNKILQGAANYKMLFSCAVFLLIVGFLMATISGYFSAMVGVSASPGSSVVIAALLLSACVVLAWINTDLLHDDALLSAEAVAIILTSMITGIAAISNDNIQDLKVGQLIGASPWKQQLMLMLGVIVASLVIPAVMQTLFKVYGIAGHSLLGDIDSASNLPAPTAALLATLTDGFFQHALPWNIILMGIVTMLGVLLIMYFVPVIKGLGLSFFGIAIGMYLPMETSSPLILGGFLSWLLHNKERNGFIKAGGVNHMICLACGLVAGSAVMDVILAMVFSLTGDVNFFSIVTHDPYHLTACLALSLILWLILKLSFKEQKK